jgi:hypothetical protein
LSEGHCAFSRCQGIADNRQKTTDNQSASLG